MLKVDEIDKLSVEDRIEKFSQLIFNKSSKDIKYLLVTNYILQTLLDEDNVRTGLYQWLNVFNGEVKRPIDVEDYNDYDIIQINMSGQDIHLVGEVRRALGSNTKTKIVLNNDYTTEMWENAFDYIPTIRREISEADMIFGTEYFQTTALTELAQRTCYIVPHPTDVKRLKLLPKLPVKNIISTIWRRYDHFSYIPSLVVRDNGLITQLLGYDADRDAKSYVTVTNYDFIYSGTDYNTFCDQLRESQIVYDPFTYHSYSRTTVDTAAMGIPVVVSNRTQSGNICYPYTCVDPYDVKTARELIRRLIDDSEFRELVVKTAQENVEFYNHINSKERYLKALYMSCFGGN